VSNELCTKRKHGSLSQAMRDVVFFYIWRRLAANTKNVLTLERSLESRMVAMPCSRNCKTDEVPTYGWLHVRRQHGINAALVIQLPHWLWQQATNSGYRWKQCRIYNVKTPTIF
jgi:hypothetical protein